MASSTSFLRGPAVLVLWGAVNPQRVDEAALNAWWTNEHLPERLAIPGFLQMRRYFAADHDPHDGDRSHYLVCYGTAALDTLSSEAYLAVLDHPTAGTKRFMPLLSSMTRSACRVLFSTGRTGFAACSQGSVGATILLLALQTSASQDERERLQDWVAREAWSKLTGHPTSTSLALHLLEHDDKVTNVGSSTSLYGQARVPESCAGENSGTSRYIVLVEFSEPLTASFGEAEILQAWLIRRLRERGVHTLESKRYGLICAVNV
ncbi:hypothetical protein PV04_07761 [Phialophora macrospora]|uniref:Uncharacterized protein n=1 Tax=Phialophora macrospora TaxID=1851006 RepID=A0A0D2CJW1_9EURO|nr:hypothetical protein PV04_07761 [Phialophora macrospora]